MIPKLCGMLAMGVATVAAVCYLQPDYNIWETFLNTPLLCLVEAVVCLLPAGAEEAREPSVDFFFHFNAGELCIEVDLLLEDVVC